MSSPRRKKFPPRKRQAAPVPESNPKDRRKGLKLRQAFQDGRRNRKPLFLPYICLGYPDYSTSLECAKAALRAGTVVLEVVVPFSDAIADGPTLQRATLLSLQKGTKPSDAFRMVRDLRRSGFDQPLLVMSYLNPVERMGWKRFAASLGEAGGDGAIVPDLPLEKFQGPRKIFSPWGLSLIPFVAPTSDSGRIQRADAQGAPFLYYVSVTGVTGERRALPAGLLESLRKLKARLRTPLVVGFGISNAAQASQVGRAGDGVIIASALVKLISKTPKEKAARKVESFCRGVVKALGKMAM